MFFTEDKENVQENIHAWKIESQSDNFYFVFDNTDSEL
jgi:hypothetical protein